MKKIRRTTILIAALFLSLPSCNRNPAAPPLSDRNSTVDVHMIASGFVSPLSLAESPDSSHRLFVVDQPGKIWIIDSSGNKLPTPFLDLSANIIALQSSYDERGLLSMAFHPDYKNNGRFFVFYTGRPRPGSPVGGGKWDNLSRVIEYKVSSADANIADPTTERLILEENHPQLNHNGGMLAFGPDGYLYISIGDGGNADDIGPGHVNDWYAINEGGNGQDIFNNLLGDILRIDINTASGYTIPADNPFISVQNGRQKYMPMVSGTRTAFRLIWVAIMLYISVMLVSHYMKKSISSAKVATMDGM